MASMWANNLQRENRSLLGALKVEHVYSSHKVAQPLGSFLSFSFATAYQGILPYLPAIIYQPG